MRSFLFAGLVFWAAQAPAQSPNPCLPAVHTGVRKEFHDLYRNLEELRKTSLTWPRVGTLLRKEFLNAIDSLMAESHEYETQLKQRSESSSRLLIAAIRKEAEEIAHQMGFTLESLIPK